MTTAIEVTDTSELTRVIKFRPAFDCIMVQPCVHGSERCIPGKGGSHGRGSVEMTMLLVGDVGAVQFGVFTGWSIDETPPNMRGHASPAEVGVHSRRPQYDDHEPQECELLNAPCYYDVGYLRAQEPWRLLRYEGHEAVWQHLESQYAEWLTSEAVSGQ